jgi:hypothetical protein
VFAVPRNHELLREQRGNIRFTQSAVPDDIRVCRVSADGHAVWLASHGHVQLRGAGDGQELRSAQPGAESLQPTASGAIAALSSVGYQAPDTIRFSRFVHRDPQLERADLAFTWSWLTPAVALAPDETLLAVHVDAPQERVIFISAESGDELGHCAFEGYVASLCFDRDAGRLYAIGSRDRRWSVAAIDVESRSVVWLRAVEHDADARADDHQIVYWDKCDSLLASAGGRVMELDPASGEPRRLAWDGETVRRVATDTSTSLACLLDDTSLVTWSAEADAAYTVHHAGDRGIDCDFRSGTIAALVGDGDQRRLLIATGVAQGPDGTVTQADARSR